VKKEKTMETDPITFVKSLIDRAESIADEWDAPNPERELTPFGLPASDLRRIAGLFRALRYRLGDVGEQIEIPRNLDAIIAAAKAIASDFESHDVAAEGLAVSVTEELPAIERHLDLAEALAV
jgi:hypothetical protein